MKQPHPGKGAHVGVIFIRPHAKIGEAAVFQNGFKFKPKPRQKNTVFSDGSYKRNVYRAVGVTCVAGSIAEKRFSGNAGQGTLHRYHIFVCRAAVNLGKQFVQVFAGLVIGVRPFPLFADVSVVVCGGTPNGKRCGRHQLLCFVDLNGDKPTQTF